MDITYRSDIGGIEAGHLAGGFCEGWPEPMTPGEHLEVLAGSDLFELAVDRATGHVVGYATALTDGRRSSFLSFLEVLPTHRGRDIGTALVQRVLDRLAQLDDGRGVNVDLSCDEALVPFYERFGMRPGQAMWHRPRLPGRA